MSEFLDSGGVDDKINSRIGERVMKRKLNYVLLFLLTIVLLPLGVKAEETYSITAEAEMKIGGKLTMILNGVSSSNDGSTSYWVYLCNDSDPAPTFEATSSSSIPVKTADLGVVAGWHQVVFDEQDASTKNPIGTINISSGWYVLNGYTTAYVLTNKKVSDTSGIKYTNSLSQKITITKPKLFDKGKGYDFDIGDKSSIYSRNSNVWPKFPYRHALEGKLNVKVGTINDSTIIKKYINNTGDAYSGLLTYAKNDKNGITMNAGDESSNLFDFNSKLDKVVEGQTYYVLITADDSSFRDLTDVYLRTGSNIGTLTEFTDKGGSTKDSSASVKQMSSKVENPKTSDANIFIMIGVLFGTLGILGVAYKKFKKA